MSLSSDAAITPAARLLDQPTGLGFAGWADKIAFWLLVLTLAWVPFPLGSNRPWSWTLMSFLVLSSWLCWTISAWGKPEGVGRSFRRVAIPFVLAALALLWGAVQIFPEMFASWVHPVWGIAADGLGKPASGMISMAPWRTATELMKLVTYMMTAWLAFVLCQRGERAQQLIDALVAIGAIYAVYALILGILGLTQLEVLYATPSVGGPLAGPFVGHAHFATFVGLLSLCACARLFALGSENIASGRGLKPLFLSTLKFVFGRGLRPLLAFVALFSMLIASASRAGVIAALIGLIVMLLLSSLISTRRATNGWAWAAIVIFAIGAVLLFQINGDTLQARFDDLTEGGAGFGLRTVFWNAASHMIGDAPWTGLGLGGFEKAYPLFADHLYPFNMDKTHNDYLELAQGLGLPATIAWFGSVLLLAIMCLRGIFVRKRHRIYALVAVSAAALVSFHAIFDFSLQIPAVSLTFAAILGMGAAQSFSSRPIV
jgi:O-antigen ligase